MVHEHGLPLGDELSEDLRVLVHRRGAPGHHADERSGEWSSRESAPNRMARGPMRTSAVMMMIAAMVGSVPALVH